MSSMPTCLNIARKSSASHSSRLSSITLAFIVCCNILFAELSYSFLRVWKINDNGGEPMNRRSKSLFQICKSPVRKDSATCCKSMAILRCNKFTGVALLHSWISDLQVNNCLIAYRQNRLVELISCSLRTSQNCTE